MTKFRAKVNKFQKYSQIECKHSLTLFPRFLDEGIHAALSVIPLRRHRGDVIPAHGPDNIHHSLCLVGVRRYHAGEEVITGVVAQLRSRGGITHLGNL